MMGSPRRANRYQFTLSNPLRYYDPDGRDPKTTITIYISDQTTGRVDRGVNVINNAVKRSASSEGKTGRSISSVNFDVRASSASDRGKKAPTKKSTIVVSLVDIGDRGSRRNLSKAVSPQAMREAKSLADDSKNAIGKVTDIGSSDVIIYADRVQKIAEGWQKNQNETQQRSDTQMEGYLSEAVIAHELGHALGLEHVDNDSDLMDESAGTDAEFNEVDKEQANQEAVRRAE